MLRDSGARGATKSKQEKTGSSQVYKDGVTKYSAEKLGGLM